jgi:predicted dehydrogenase
MNSINRRHFFHAAGMAIAASQASRVMGANDRIHVGVVGLGHRGNAHLGFYGSLEECEIVALCDVNQAARERALTKVQAAGASRPKEYVDMQELFADKNVDTVSLPLPNHWHALATIWACQAGKDVYVEKPACHNVYEGRKMVEAARKHSRMVQVGSQGRTMPHKIKAIQLLRDGVIGDIYMAKGLCYKRRPSIGHKPDSPVPPGVDWDRFRGPAPMIPFNENRFAYNWHWFWDTGNGDIGNQGIHEMDIARWGLGKPGLPASVVSTGGKFVYKDDQQTPNTQTASFDYGDAELVFEVRGLRTGSEGGVIGARGNIIGDLFYGADGWMALHNSGFQVYKGEDNKKIMDEPVVEKETASHVQNFFKAVRSRRYQDLNADVEVGVMSATLVHMANASYRVGKRLAWDEKSWKFKDSAEANELLTRHYRAPYTFTI